MGIDLEQKVFELDDRTDRLEILYGKFIVDVNLMLNRLGRRVEQLSYEMKEFKDEMKEFKDEMKEFKDEMKEFKDEMKEFKEWSKSNIEWSKNQIREMNKQWGNMANKLGTIVEDIIFPATRPILNKYFNCEPETLAMNIERKRDNIRGEFDVLAVCDDKVFLIEVKTSPNKKYIDDFFENKVSRFKLLFPEYSDKKLILILGALRLTEDIVKYLTEKGIYAMAYREWEYMDILNFDELSGRV